ncbi:universal stress protein [Variovorax sp. J22R133]|uniref:universal stress protein n=1 Tax=Variovorax brevis TaxID=3053503 RepID=UPI0025772A63|nr:universal stress protein [Variovorax sp. J22R133]MDM0116356.1 universal stress protein [Variovorax sp. J22R133]
MYQEILVPLDDSPTARRGPTEAIRLAALIRSRLHLLTVIDDFPLLAELASVANFDSAMQQAREHASMRACEHAKAVLDRASTLAAASDVQADTALREITGQRVADVILEESARAGCDLIVMGTHGRKGLQRMALGSDAEHVLRNSTTPVLLVRGATDS